MYSCFVSEIFCKNKCIGEICLGEGGKDDRVVFIIFGLK